MSSDQASQSPTQPPSHDEKPEAQSQSQGRENGTEPLLEKPLWHPSWDPKKDPYALHTAAQMLEPAASRIAWAREALAAGRDPNAIDGCPRVEGNRNRPLHAALSDPGDWDAWAGKPRERPESLDFIRFLLDSGADPRLRDCEGRMTPAESARDDAPSAPQENVKRFLLEAAGMMEEAEAKLNGGATWGGRAASVLALPLRLVGLGVDADADDKREVFCRFCKEGTRHAWHYWCYADTGEERRTFEVTDNLVRPARA